MISLVVFVNVLQICRIEVRTLQTGCFCFDSLQSVDFNPANLQDIYKQT